MNIVHIVDSMEVGGAETIIALLAACSAHEDIVLPCTALRDRASREKTQG